MEVREKLVELCRLAGVRDKGVALRIADCLVINGVTVQELDGCNYCKAPVYIKTIQYSAPVLAPMTRTEELRQQLYNLTGEVYSELPKRFCPMCGRRLPQPPKGE